MSEIDPWVQMMVEEHCGNLLDAGFVSRDTLEDVVTEMAETEGLEKGEVLKAVDMAWKRKRREEATWEDEGDYVKLKHAFDELERNLIFARMDYMCCQSCGHAELQAEAKSNPGVRGYVFFHEQDSERLQDGYLFLAFADLGEHSTLEESEKATQAIGEEISETLTCWGLEVIWDKTPASRIRVELPQWRKRMPPSLGEIARLTN